MQVERKVRVKLLYVAHGWGNAWYYLLDQDKYVFIKKYKILNTQKEITFAKRCVSLRLGSW